MNPFSFYPNQHNNHSYDNHHHMGVGHHQPHDSHLMAPFSGHVGGHGYVHHVPGMVHGHASGMGHHQSHMHHGDHHSGFGGYKIKKHGMSSHKHHGHGYGHGHHGYNSNSDSDSD